jgi:hypothetical protein
MRNRAGRSVENPWNLIPLCSGDATLCHARAPAPADRCAPLTATDRMMPAPDLIRSHGLPWPNAGPSRQQPPDRRKRRSGYPEIFTRNLISRTNLKIAHFQQRRNPPWPSPAGTHSH